MRDGTLRIGGASGFWGDSAVATPQLLGAGRLDYIVYDYLAEITMSILARARARDPSTGYATDFISLVLKPNLAEIAKQGVRIIANAGGLNPAACAAAARALVAEAGLGLKVAVVTGDDLTPRAEEIAARAPREMFTGAPFPAPASIASINAYLGAFPIARALAMGADIVITGRCVDSAVTLAPCIHEFGWGPEDHDLLASGSLAGHVIECGPQATGGNFTDWRDVGDIARIGYPIAEISADGSFVVTKPDGTAGLVSVGTVSEQLLYEIGDPQAYILPDVVCDLSGVTITQAGADRVAVSPAKGRPAPDAYKTCATYRDGYRTGLTATFYGLEAHAKARAFCDAVFARARATLRRLNVGDFTETSVEMLGAESQFGAAATAYGPREVVAKIAVKHAEEIAGAVFLKELSGLGLATPPGLSGFQGSRAKPSPLVRLFSYLTPKAEIDIAVELDGAAETVRDAPGAQFDAAAIERAAPPPAPEAGPTTDVPLIRLAWGRSGDKGDKANIGIIARKPEHLPHIWAALDEAAVAEAFAHFIEGGADPARVERYVLPGSNAVNFLIDRVLGGGGVASLRNDPQGKGYAQVLLSRTIPVPVDLARTLA